MTSPDSINDREPQVYLVGAGPGDPGLMTRRGEAVLRRADVVFYDFLTNPVLLDLAPSGARRVHVGKRPGSGASVEQASIHQQLIDAAGPGRVVVRLKGGDGFIFGRGGEEAEALLAAGVPFEVVPGLTSAISVPALAGIALTHRERSSVLQIVTGHEDPASPDCSVRWDLLARTPGTLVILMGMARLPAILGVLLAEGMDPATPMAIIHWGSYPRQVSIRTSLAEAAANLSSVRMRAPSIVVLGAVAGSDQALNWFEQRPLFGRRVLLTRPAGTGEAIAEALRAAGAEVAQIPAVRFDAADAEGGASDLIERLGALSSASGWLVAPSPAAIRFLFATLAEAGKDARALAGIRIAVIGAAGAEDLRARGVEPDFVSPTPSAVALAESLPLSEGASEILIAGSANSRPELAEGLRARGFSVRHLTLYSTVPDREGLERIDEALERGAFDDVVVFSPSAAAALSSLRYKLEPDQDAAGPRWVGIGPTTAGAMRELGFRVAAVAAAPTAQGLGQALADASATPQASARVETRPGQTPTDGEDL